MDKLKNVIGLCGEMGAGKSEVARILECDSGFVRVKMTDPINAMLSMLGIPADQLDGPDRDRPHPLLLGKSIRHAQQTLGTEWGRDLISQGLWVYHWGRTVSDVLDHGGRVVCENIRFPDEVEVLHGFRGELWEVRRPGLEGPQHAHESENHRDFRKRADRIIDNDGSLDDLRRKVNAIARSPDG